MSRFGILFAGEFLVIQLIEPIKAHYRVKFYKNVISCRQISRPKRHYWSSWSANRQCLRTKQRHNYPSSAI